MTRDELITKASEILQVDGSKIDIETLYRRLKDFRNELHPDKVIDEAEKSSREEEFKNITPILEGLEKEIQRDQRQRLPAKIAKSPVSKATDIMLEMKLRRAEDETHTLQSEVMALKRSLDEAKKLLEDSKKDVSSKLDTIARESAKPNNLPEKLGIGVVWTLALISSFNKDLFGFIGQLQNQGVLSSALIPIIFWISFFAGFYFILKKQLRSSRLNKLLDALYTAEIRRSFSEQMPAKESFTESQVTTFIRSHIQNIQTGTALKRILNSLIGNSLAASDLHLLGQAFIAKLLEDNLIEFQGANNLEKKYSINKVGRWW